MLLTQLCMQVLDLVFDDLGIAEAGLVDQVHSLLYDVWVGRISHLEKRLLLDQEYAII